MRKYGVVAFLTLASGYLAAPHAYASTLFDSGPYSGVINSWDISNTSSVPAPADNIANNFILSGPAIVSGGSFVVWTDPGDTMTSVEYSITSTPGGAALVTGTVPVVQTFLTTDIYGYAIDEETFSITPTTLSAGTYWLELENADDAGGNLYFWDENDNPNSINGLQAWDASLGGGPAAFLSPTGDPADCPSVNCTDTFTITGTPLPEPGSFQLLASGILGLAILLMRRILAPVVK